MPSTTPVAPDPIVGMSAEQKLEAALRLYWSARALKRAAIRAAHPTWPDERLDRAVRAAFLLHRE